VTSADPTTRRGSSPEVAHALTGGRWAYAIGTVGTRLPTEGVEHELRQAIGGDDPMDLAHADKLRTALTNAENRYLVRELSWVLTIDGIDSYVLQPSDPSDLMSLPEAIRPDARGYGVDAVLGRIASPTQVNPTHAQAPLPMLIFDQLHSFDADTFAKSLQKATGLAEIDPTFVADMLRTLTSISGPGLTGEHRALNYLVLRYPKLYQLAFEKAQKGFSLRSVRFSRPPATGGRTLVVVLLTFDASEDSRVEKWSVRVDVTDKFPFLRAALAPHLLTS
jgi:hypothetical protein